MNRRERKCDPLHCGGLRRNARRNVTERISGAVRAKRGGKRETSEEREPYGMKILVVDDDRELVDLLTYCLRGFGYEVVRAFDGVHALKLWREQRPDLVILDVEMPKLDGFEVCRRMTNESTALVLFLTCHDREADEVHGLDLGADDYLHKPFRPKQLLARIRAL